MYQLNQNRKKSDECRYIFKARAYNKKKSAGEIFETDFMYEYQHNSNVPVPKIAFINFVSKELKMKCGKVQCPKSKVITTAAPIAPIVVDGLSGNTCSKYIKITSSNPGSQSGTITFIVPEATVSWEMQVKRFVYVRNRLARSILCI